MIFVDHVLDLIAVSLIMYDPILPHFLLIMLRDAMVMWFVDRIRDLKEGKTKVVQAVPLKHFP